MGKKTLVLGTTLSTLGALRTLGLLSPVIVQLLALTVILTVVSAIVIVFFALFNQKVCNRLIKIVTAILSPCGPKTSTKKN
jgi:hypothetical protein